MLETITDIISMGNSASHTMIVVGCSLTRYPWTRTVFGSHEEPFELGRKIYGKTYIWGYECSA